MTITPEMQEALAARLRFYRELGIHDLYRRETALAQEPPSNQADESDAAPESPSVGSAGHPSVPTALDIATAEATRETAAPVHAMGDGSPESTVAFEQAGAEAHDGSLAGRVAALEALRAEIGDCTRCPLAFLGRHTIVFGKGDPQAEIMFVGEGPGADEDAQGQPFVGRAGQLLNNMIAAMGLERQQVYVANVVKCRPPQNRTPEKVECDTCSPFLLRQIEIVRPKVLVALGATAARTLLRRNDSMARMRGRFYDVLGTQLLVTYHPAYLLRDPSQKKEAWKDLQMVMQHLGMTVPRKQ